MTLIGLPRLTSFGNSFTNTSSINLNDHESPDTSIDAQQLNITKLDGGVELSDFEETIKAYVLSYLGYPVVRVELVDTQIKICIDEALSRLDYYAPMWTTQFLTFEASAGINTYKLPLHVLRNLVYVTYKKSLLSIQAQAGSLEFDVFLKYFQDNYLFNDFDIGEYYLLQMTMETTRRVLGQDGGWDIIDGQYLMLSPSPSVTPEPVIVEYRSINSAVLLPFYKSWVQKYALACARVILGEIRGKFTSVPGPGGGVQLNGTHLIQRGMQEKASLEAALMSEIDMGSRFLTG